MAVILVRELGHGRRRGEVDDRLHRRYVRKYRVYTDTITTTAGEVLGAQLLGLPARWSSYPTDVKALCKKLEADETEDPQRWEVSAEYDTRLEIEGDVAEDPLTEPKQESYGWERTEVALEEDLSFPNPQTIRNSAEDRFEPPITVPNVRLVLTIRRNEATFNLNNALNFINTTNQLAFRGKPPRTWLMTDFSGEKANKGPQVYWRVTYQVVHHRQSWDLELLDQGYRKKNGANGWLEIKDDGGHKLTQPALLDGNGQPLPRGGVPVYLTFQVYPELDWTLLNL